MAPERRRRAAYGRGRSSASPIESLYYHLRKIIKNRGHFPSDEAVIKPLRISEIGLAVPDVSGLTTTVTPPLGTIAVTLNCQASPVEKAST